MLIFGIYAKPPHLQQIRRLTLNNPSQNRKENRMRKTLRVSALVLALSCTAYAGHIPNMITDEPPPPTPESTVEPSMADGIVQNDNTCTLTEAILNALGSALSLL